VYLLKNSPFFNGSTASTAVFVDFYQYHYNIMYSTSEMATPNLTKIREIHTETFQQPYSDNNYNFILRLLDVLYFFNFFLRFIGLLVAEISKFISEIQRIFTDLRISLWLPIFVQPNSQKFID
jgi:hypothetical protein